MAAALSRRTIRGVATMASGGLVATLAACGGSGGGGSDSGTITIGYSAGISGGAAEYGINVQNGLQMAIDEVNEAGVEVDGTEYTVELESLDDQYQPGTTGTNAQRLVQQDGADAVAPGAPSGAARAPPPPAQYSYKTLSLWSPTHQVRFLGSSDPQLAILFVCCRSSVNRCFCTAQGRW